MHAHHAHHRLDERRREDRRALAIALVLIVGLIGAEVAAGLVARSLALLADAGHLLTDAAALGLALVAASLAGRPARGRWTFGLSRLEVLASPGEIDPSAVGRTLVAQPQVVEVHDLHVWTVTSGFPALSAHVLVQQGADCHGLRRELEVVLADRFGLTHTTLQVDHAPEALQPVELGAPFRREGPL